jgi:hypothetical protein
VSAIDTLLAIGDVSPPMAQAIVEWIAAGNSGSQLATNAGWVIGQALRSADPKGVFGAYLNDVHPSDLPGLRLGKKTDALVDEAEKLHRQLDRYAYGPPAFRFTEADVDQARAAGGLIELDRGQSVITDRALYRELAKQAIAGLYIDICSARPILSRPTFKADFQGRLSRMVAPLRGRRHARAGSSHARSAGA